MAIGRLPQYTTRAIKQNTGITSKHNKSTLPASGAVGTPKWTTQYKKKYPNQRPKGKYRIKYTLQSIEEAKSKQTLRQQSMAFNNNTRMVRESRGLKSTSTEVGDPATSKDGSVKTNHVDESKLDIEKLNSISEVYMRDTNEWNNLNSVEIKLKELEEQLNKTANVKTRKQINCLITTYEIQLKRLLIQQNQELATTNNDGNSYMSPISIPESQEVETTTETDTIMSELVTISDVEEVKCLTQGASNTSSGLSSKGTKGKKEKETECQMSTPQQSKRKSGHDSIIQLEPAQKKKPTFKDALAGVKGNENGSF